MEARARGAAPMVREAPRTSITVAVSNLDVMVIVRKLVTSLKVMLMVVWGSDLEANRPSRGGPARFRTPARV